MSDRVRENKNRRSGFSSQVPILASRREKMVCFRGLTAIHVAGAKPCLSALREQWDPFGCSLIPHRQAKQTNGQLARNIPERRRSGISERKPRTQGRGMPSRKGVMSAALFELGRKETPTSGRGILLDRNYG